MALSERQLLDALSRTPFVDSMELALILGGASRDRSPCAYRPAGRRHHREGQPRHRPSAVEPAILPDGQRHPRDRLDARLCDSLGLRAGLPNVQGVADAAHPKDGRSGRHLPSCRLNLPRHRRSSGPTWSSTAGAVSTPPSPSTTAAASAWCARAWPYGAGLSTTG